ncbi:hypothetical protein [Salmonella phage vB_SenS_SB13]|uniref:Uncharacterized protein n=1 Tax=Salmonella phage vB_SenS_SB13 TaxID=2591135 RepID=A0A5J6T9K9_9CAUD|nr:hypothetical protein HWC37_gp092 [Salmonella phage vB_SenS_SB13]QFG07626.1 hypothetical protein [Salmonella phage vB_SenS_SB13]
MATLTLYMPKSKVGNGKPPRRSLNGTTKELGRTRDNFLAGE